MSDDEVDLELLDLLRKSLGITNQNPNEVSSDTGVLKDAEFIYNNSIDVFIDMYGTKAAASAVYTNIQERGYSTANWSEHELHPKVGNGFSEIDMVNFIFTMDLLNFSFWSDLPEPQRFQVEYRGKRWTGYNSLVACLRRALDEDIFITTPKFWRSQAISDESLRHVFRSATGEIMPLLDQRLAILREAGEILHETFGDRAEHFEEDTFEQPEIVVENENIVPNAFPTNSDSTDMSKEALEQDIQTPGPTKRGVSPAPDTPNPECASSQAVASEAALSQDTTSGIPSDTISPASPTHTNDRIIQQPSITKPDLSVVRLVEEAGHSAGKLVNLLVKHFPAFRDETRFEGRKVGFYKRAQIFVADLWAATNGTGHGEFHDIDHLTMFADYRVPQILTSLGILSYSPPLLYAIKDGKTIPSGHSWEVQLRGCSIWAVELMRREIVKDHPGTEINAVLIDFFLYDLAKEKEREAKAKGREVEKCHRVRSVWY